jgi:hypothetical protein
MNKNKFTLSLLPQFLFVINLTEEQLIKKIELGEIQATKIKNKWIIYQMALPNYLRS